MRRDGAGLGLSAVMSLALLVGACSGTSTDTTPSTVGADPGPTTTTSVQAATTTVATTTTSTSPPLEASTITVLGTGESQTITPFAEAFAAFSEASGVQIDYVAVDDPIESILAGTEADLIVSVGGPALGPIADGPLRPLPTSIDTEALAQSTLDGVLDSLVLPDGTFVALPLEVTPKSLLWTSSSAPPGGVSLQPGSVEDLVALTDAISPADPTWCLGIMAGDATGWILTDWLEDLLLHQSGADAYRSFVAGDLPFTSAEVMAAAEAMDAMLSTEGAVLGGLADAANRSFFDVANPLADTPPGCWITHQASFQRAFFRLAGIDPIGSVDVMRTPGPTAADALMVASVSTVSLTSDNPEAAAFLEHLADPSAATLRFGSGYTFSPYEAFDLAGYPDDPLTLRMAEALAGSTVFPDASDLMADGLRSTFHRELVAWATGQQGIGDALEAVEAARTGG